MMKIYLKRAKSNVDAVAEYDEKLGTVRVLKGSRVSATVAHSEKFRGAKSVEKFRAESVVGTEVVRDICFKSTSTAANFVTGASTNGLTAWKDNEGHTLKELAAEEAKK